MKLPETTIRQTTEPSLVYGKRIAIQCFRRHNLVTAAIEKGAGFLKIIQTIDNSFLLSQSTPRLLFYLRISSSYTYKLEDNSTKLGITYKQASFYTLTFQFSPRSTDFVEYTKRMDQALRTNTNASCT